MTISQNVWRFQCDPDGSDDPTVQVFLKKTLYDADSGETFEKLDYSPVNMKFSELTSVSDLTNVTKVTAVQAEQIQPSPPVLGVNP